MKNIVVFASGSGTNFQAVIDAINRGDINARISGLVTNKAHIGAIDRANKYNISSVVFNPAEFDDEQDYARQLLAQLKAWNTDLIVLAGYLKKIPSEIIKSFPGRIINIHPALLPKFGGKGFYGHHVHKAVIDAGEKKSGCTVHVVTDEFDAGPVLAQIEVPVRPDDSPATLAQRILEQEHILLPKVINQVLKTL